MNKAARSSAPQIRISGYRILHEVGRGGISTVYLAVQESLQREVVLKVMSPALTTDPSFTDRFIHEGRVIAQLSHPGIVTIYDISVDDYHHYIAMEYLQGGSLKQRIKNRLAPDQALDILYQVGSALEYAHEKRIVHRDVKPENIIFRDIDGSEAVLTDFGIAKSHERHTQLTSAGMVVGTPRYMSPEQAEGKGATAKSDIYALGIILYEMLTGVPPYQGKESLAVLYSHLNDPIPELPEQYGYLQPLLESMLQKDPADRIDSCADLLDQLEGFQYTPGSPESAGGGVRTRLLGLSALRRKVFRIFRAFGRYLAWGAVAVIAVVIVSTVIWGLIESPVAVIENELPEGEPPVIVAPTKIDLTKRSGGIVAGEKHLLEAPVDIGSLLNLARKQIESGRLTTPTGNNAADTYRAVLKIEPGNTNAERGLADIASRYHALAQEQLRSGDYVQAEVMVRSGLSVQPEHGGLLALSRQIAHESSRRTEAGPAGTGEEPIDRYVKALVDNNFAEAQFQTAVAFASGDGVARDMDQALIWLRKAADGGHVEAQYNLALGLLFGPKPDVDEAARIIKSLAYNEYKPAYRVLGWMYTTGTGLRRRVKPAVRWSAMASTWGEPALPNRIVEPWQRAFDEKYEETVAKVSDEQLRLPENLK